MPSEKDYGCSMLKQLRALTERLALEEVMDDFMNGSPE
jgi:hypothetical protein